MNFRFLHLSAVLLVSAAYPAYAVDRTWDAGAGTTNWYDAVNWSANTTPTNVDRAIINMASGAVVGSPGAVSNELRLGSTAGGTGNLTISGGGTLTTTGTGNIGYFAGSASPFISGGIGTATITGSNSLWTLSSTINVGQGINSTGTLNIQNGGAVSAASGRIASSVGSTGTATVTGTNSSWTNSGLLTIGERGTAVLNIQNQGTVSSSAGYIGANTGATGTVTVNGTGSTWTSSGDLRVGAGGTGTLNIQAGGVVNSGLGRIGLVAGSAGTVTVTGAGSSWMGSDNIYVGETGTGTMNILAGGTVSTSLVRVGANTGSDGTFTISGAGSRIDSNEWRLGNSGTGTLNIQSGATVNSTTSNIAALAGSSGTATVTGSGSSWINSSDLGVGRTGTGAMSVQNGATVSSVNGRIGTNAGSTGTATVTGSGSSWANSAILLIAESGTGTLTLSDNGETSATGGVGIGNSAGSNGALNIGAASASPAAAPGTLITDTVTFGAGTGAINFNHTSSNYLFAPSISGSGTLNFVAGTTTLTGDNRGFTGTISGNASIAVTSDETAVVTDSSAFSGVTGVSGGGTLRVNGALGGLVSVGSGGTLGGGGTVGDIEVNADGTAAPGNSIGTLSTTTVTFNPGSVYEVEVNAAGQSDLIDASGAATLNGGLVTAIPFPDFRLNQAYTILTAAGGVTGAFDGTNNNFLLFDSALSYDANNVYLTLQQDAVALRNVAATRNQQAVAGGILNASPDNPAIVALFTSPDANSARAGLDSLSGEVHAQMRGALMREQSLIRTAPTLAADRQISSERGRLWTTGFGSRGKADGDGNAASHDRRNEGAMIGAEWKSNHAGWHEGFAVGQSRTRLDLDARSSEAESDNTHVMAYTQGPLPGGASIQAGASYTYHAIDTERVVTLPGFEDRAEADYSAHTEQVFAEASKSFGMGASTIEPFVSGVVINTHGGKIRESGTAALTGEVEQVVNGLSEFGLRGERSFDGASVRLSAGWQHRYGDRKQQAELTFSGSPNSTFKITDAPLDADALTIGAGLQADPAPGINFAVRYNGIVSQNNQDHTFSASAAVKF